MKTSLHLVLTAACFSMAMLIPATSSADQKILSGPLGSGAFGTAVAALPNGNIVVTDPNWNNGSASNVGAVYLYTPQGVKISRLAGSTSNDRVGDSTTGIIVLPSGNFIVISPNWQNGATARAGAVTWVNGTTGLDGVVSSSNSLIGSSTDDMLNAGITVLANGHCVLTCPNWNKGAVAKAGAVTLINGTTGLAGVLSSANSLIGSTANDRVGSGGITPLTKGHYVVKSPSWSNGSAASAGAATWASGAAGVKGPVSPANSLVGSTANDFVGTEVVALTNGNYVVASKYWSTSGLLNIGAATWGDGSKGISGPVSINNSLYGVTSTDLVGTFVYALPNGNYVVATPAWHFTTFANAGAVTWGDGAKGTTGSVNFNNSIAGSRANEFVGGGTGGGVGGVTVLTNGNYVINSPLWYNGAVVEAGAATWASGTTVTKGYISASNSLVGSQTNDHVGGNGVFPLTNGNYVVCSPDWANAGMAKAGAVTWQNGKTGGSGPVTTANSLVGSAASNRVGSGGVVALKNGFYAAVSPLWSNGATTGVGAVTFGNGNVGLRGVAVSTTNSIYGARADDAVGSGGVFPLTNGNFVISSPSWDDSGIADAGAVTWGNGFVTTSGAVTSANSLVGSSANDRIGTTVTPLNDGNYLVGSRGFNGPSVSSGALTWGDGATGVHGVITALNSILGTNFGDQVGAPPGGLGGAPVTLLPKGAYIAATPTWNLLHGAVTLGIGGQPTAGLLSSDNSVLNSGPVPGSPLDYDYSTSWEQMVVGLAPTNEVALFSLAPPPIKVEKVVLPTNVVLADGDTQDFGGTLTGKNTSITFKITNLDAGALTGLTLVKDGPNPAEFAVTDFPATKNLAAGESFTFTIKFSPAKDGARTAYFHINSPDLSKSSFEIVAAGIGVVPVSPIVKTLPATAVDFQKATLHGTVDAKNSLRNVTFEYGPTTAYGSQIAAVPATVNGTTVTDVSVDLTGLPPHTKFNYRVKADGFFGAAVGGNLTFATLDHPPVAVDDTFAILPGAKATLDVLTNDTDLDLDTLSLVSFTALSNKAAGTLAKNGSTLLFTAAAGFSGSATFDYVTTDGFGMNATGHVTLNLGTIGIDPPTKSLPSAGASYVINVTSSGAWSAVESLPWITVSPINGSGNGPVTVTLQPNAAKLQRSGSIVIGGLVHTITQEGVIQPKLTLPDPIPAAAVSAFYSLTVPTEHPPVTYTATKLPPGLTLSNLTGVISGTPTLAGIYDVVIKASNAAGPADPITVRINVAALPAGAVGVFNGFVTHSPLNGQMGSRIELTTTLTGSYTGKMITGATSLPLTGKLLADPGDTDHPELKLVITPKTGPQLTLDLTLDGPGHTLSGTYTNGTDTSTVSAWHNPWSTTQKATAFATLHNFSLMQTSANASDMTLPQGSGFGSFTPKETTGAVSVAGKLMDGSPFTSATFVGKDGQVLIYQSLYGNKGSFAGSLAVTAGATPADNTIPATSGLALQWSKPKSPASAKDTLYPNGFGPIEIVAEGAAYVPPAKGAVVMGLPNQANNANLDVSGAGLDTEGPATKEFDITFSLLNPSSTGLTNKATMPSSNPNSVALPTVTPATGAFSGNFTIPNALAKLNRKVTFQGLIVKHGASSAGYGFFLLPSLPVGSETLATSPKHSGMVFLGEAPPPGP